MKPRQPLKKPWRKGLKKTSRKKHRFRGLFLVLFLALLVLLTFATGIYVFVIRSPSLPVPTPQKPSPAPLPIERRQTTPEAKIHPLPPEDPVSKKEARPARPRLAIVIDDMGFLQQEGERFLALDLPLTYAFLPFAPQTESLARQARAAGRDVLLHLPLESKDHRHDPGQGALYLAMARQDLVKTLEMDLAAVPGAIGVNNHMGSRFTEDRDKMIIVLDIIKGRNLLFVDSFTAPQSVAFALAREKGMAAARRNVFLDNTRRKEEISEQLESLLQLAERDGRALGVGHPYAETLAVLDAFQNQLRTRVELVGISVYIGETAY